MKCPHCNSIIGEDFEFCPNCGSAIPKKKRKGGLIFGCIMGVLLLIALITIVFLVLKSRNVLEEKKESIQSIQEESYEYEEIEEPEITEESEVDLETGTESRTDDTSIEAVIGNPMDHIESVTATSSLSEYNMTHNPERVTDGILSQGWAEGAEGQGLGEFITICFDDAFQVNGLVIHAGLQQSEELYYKNSRPKDVRISFEDGSSEMHTLNDVYGSQKIVLDKGVVTDSVSVTIESVYPGNKYEDTVISEISVY